MAQVVLTTYQDLIDHLTDFLGANAGNAAYRDIKRAILAAWQTFPNEHNWSFYYQRGRLNTVAMYNAGTVQYRQSSGAQPQLLTLTGGSWPSWVLQGTVLLNNIEYPVAAQIDGQNITLADNANPGADVAAGTTYMAYQDTYPLPTDFRSMDELVNATYVLGLEYVHPNNWLTRHRLVYTPSTPHRYTITGHPNFQGTMAARFFPAPDVIYQMDYIYQRRPRPLAVERVNAGKVSVALNGSTVSGAGTAFSSRHVGCVIRFSADGVNAPTSPVGSNPYYYERVITAVASASSATIDAAIPEALTSVAYTVSDPVDVEQGAMLSAFLRLMEVQVARVRNMKERGEFDRYYQEALTLAKEADSRSTQSRRAGGRMASGLRLAYMPRGPDIG